MSSSPAPAKSALTHGMDGPQTSAERPAARLSETLHARRTADCQRCPQKVVSRTSKLRKPLSICTAVSTLWPVVRERGIWRNPPESVFQASHISIRYYWKSFVRKLRKHSVDLEEDRSPRGYAYYLRQDTGPVRVDNAFLVGDAAGLATVDMGEGIGPAVQSGILAARAIARGVPYTLKNLGKFSLRHILMPGS